MGVIGRPKEAQWWFKGGRSIAQIDAQCLQEYAFFQGRPMAYTCASFLRPRQCVCAFFPPPLSDLWATDLLDDPCATVLNMLKTSRRPWRPWRGLNVLCATLERSRQPFALLCDFNGDLASFVVAQGRHNVFSKWPVYRLKAGHFIAKFVQYICTLYISIIHLIALFL